MAGGYFCGLGQTEIIGGGDMSGDWLKIEVSLPEKPEVWHIAGLVQCDPDAVVGKLIKVWRWFDAHTENGNALSVTSALLDSVVGVTGFAQAMRSAGWLHCDGSHFSLPHFDRHNGKTAKNRALTAKRVAKAKAKSGNAEVTLRALPREEKRREEKKQDQEPVRSPAGSRLPADWAPSPEGVAFAETKRPGLDWRSEAEAFRDYWSGVAGAKGRKADWPATWRNWIRRAEGRPRAGPSGMTPSRQMTAVADLLGVHTDDLTTRALVRSADSPLSGGAVPAEPRRLPGR